MAVAEPRPSDSGALSVICQFTGVITHPWGGPGASPHSENLKNTSRGAGTEGRLCLKPHSETQSEVSSLSICIGCLQCPLPKSCGSCDIRTTQVAWREGLGPHPGGLCSVRCPTHLGLPETVLVFKLQVPHPGSPCSPRQIGTLVNLAVCLAHSP